MTESSSVDLPSSSSAEEMEYRAAEPWAVIGLLAGFLAPLALLGGLMTMVAVLAIVANLVALVRLKREPWRTGRAAAIVGLALAVLFTAAPIAQWATSYVLLSTQPREMADQWFELLRQGSPEKALRLRFAPDQRPPLDDGLWLHFRHDDDAKAELRAFVTDPVVRALLALGERAQVRFYKTHSVVSEGTLAGVQYVYTVTFPDVDGKKTFFVSLILERKPTNDPRLNPWRVKTHFAGKSPPGAPT
jgi:hypothetical protein